MSDLIKRKDALRELCQGCLPNGKHPDHGCADPCNEYHGIDSIPAVDAVEVVRCRECKYCDTSSFGGRYCSLWDVDNYEEAFVEDDDFCSKGEMRSE